MGDEESERGVIDMFLRCVPPRITAQMKRIRVVNGKPVFFHSSAMKMEANIWALLLQPYRPEQPMDGPLTLSMKFVYPHVAATKKADREQLIPKTTKPDAGNTAKHLEDLLTKMRFIADDARFYKVNIEKWHGPADLVGITIQIRRGVA